MATKVTKGNVQAQEEKAAQFEKVRYSDEELQEFKAVILIDETINLSQFALYNLA